MSEHETVVNILQNRLKARVQDLEKRISMFENNLEEQEKKQTQFPTDKRFRPLGNSGVY